MRLTIFPAFDPETGDLNMIVETPKDSRNKYKYDDRLRVVSLDSELPAGAVFPYDFGFVPSTRGDDGDPLDVLVLMDEPSPGAFPVSARLVGVIEANLSTGDGTERNDRLIAVSTTSHTHEHARHLRDLGEETLSQIEHFVVSYNQARGKEFKPEGRHGPGRARKLVRAGERRFRAAAAGKRGQKSKRGSRH
jgi:inorganic pyrophosphatase